MIPDLLLWEVGMVSPDNTVPPALQDHWMHNVPKRAGIGEPRINLTFRRVVHPLSR